MSDSSDMDMEMESSSESEPVCGKLVPKTNPFLQELVILNIFKRLELENLISCRVACKLWNDVSHPILTSKLDGVKIRFEAKRDGSEFARMNYFLDMLQESSIRFTNFEFEEINLNTTLGKLLVETIGPDIKILLLEYPKRQMGEEWQWGELYGNGEPQDDEGHPPEEEEQWFRLKKNRPIDLEKFRDLVTNCPNLNKLGIMNLPATIKSSALFPSDSENVPILPITQIDLYYSAPSKYSKSFLHDLFKASPNLSTVSYDVIFDISTQGSIVLRVDSFIQDLIVLEALESSGRLGAIKHLKLCKITGTILGKMDTLTNPRNGNGHFSSLTTLFLRTIYLNLNEATEVSPTNFSNLFNNVRHTLRHLRFDIFGWLNNQNMFTIQFPEMTELRELSMIIRILAFPNSQTISFGELVFSTQFPKLRKLRIRGDAQTLRFEDFSSPFNLIHPQYSLTYLELPQMINSPLGIQHLGKIFPNVRDLVVAAQNDLTFQAIWTSWTLIEKLHLSVYEQFGTGNSELGLDSLFTGIPRQMCEEMSYLKECDKKKLHSFIPLGPSITNLKQLRRLILHSGPDIHSMRRGRDRDPKDKLTDTSCSIAFSKLPKLEYLAFGRQDHISAEGISEILDAHPEMRIISMEEDFGVVLGNVNGKDPGDPYTALMAEEELEFWNHVNSKDLD